MKTLHSFVYLSILVIYTFCNFIRICATKIKAKLMCHYLTLCHYYQKTTIIIIFCLFTRRICFKLYICLLEQKRMCNNIFFKRGKKKKNLFPLQ
jgi:hypothetical protein